MFTAMNHLNQPINLLDGLPALKEKYHCPGCRSPVRMRRGEIMRPHFAHLSLKDCQYFSENESLQHLNLKASFYRWARQTERVGVEVYLASIQQVADIVLNGQLVLEVQCSSLSLKRLRERTEAYQANGLEVLWLLGKELWLKNRLTPLQKQFLRFSKNSGFHLWEADLDRNMLRLNYLIHEDLHGNCQYVTKEFPFFQGSLAQILRFPYQSQHISSFEARMDTDFILYLNKQLYFQNPKWLKKQQEAYEKGENLLTKSLEDFYPQVQLPVSSTGFSQIKKDLAPFYKAFETYYHKAKDKQRQILYSPAFYLLDLAGRKSDNMIK